MCLAVPAQLIAVNDAIGTVELTGATPVSYTHLRWFQWCSCRWWCTRYYAAKPNSMVA